MFSWTKKKEEKRIAEEQEIRETREMREKYRQVLIAFRNIGEKFTFLGHEMLVVRHEIKDGMFRFRMEAIIKTAFVDKMGAIQYKDFFLEDIPVLMAENKYARETIEEARQIFFIPMRTDDFLEEFLTILKRERP